MNAFVLGIAAVIFALATNAPGMFSFIGLLSPVAALLAVIAGIRALGQVSGPQRALALRGMMAGIFGAILFVVFLVSQSNNTMKAMGPQTFSGSGIQLTYPGNWQPVDISQSTTCKQTGVTCVMALSPADGTSFNIIRTTLPQATTMDAVADVQLWQQYHSGAPTATRTGDTLITVGGQPAVRWLMDLPSTAVASGHDYIDQVYVVNGTAFYTITGLAITQDTLTTYQPTIDGIVSSIKFTP
jgi:hypothetical protein